MVSYFILCDVGLHAPCWRCWDDRCLAESFSQVLNPFGLVKSWKHNRQNVEFWGDDQHHPLTEAWVSLVELASWELGPLAAEWFPNCFLPVSCISTLRMVLGCSLFYTVLLVSQILRSCVSPECLRMHFHSLALLWDIMWQASWQI